jgi:hypothetical protein
MFRFGHGVREWSLAIAAAALVALAVVWLEFDGSLPELASDFEDCVERVQAQGLSADELGGGLAACGARFAGRRKADGGYTYYDFMQDRNFDIAGANPTAEERKQIDRQYMGFLDAQRREAISAELAKRQNEQLRADLEDARQTFEPPMVLAPRSQPSSAAKRLIGRSKSTRCEAGSLTCSWAKFSAVVKNALASSSRTKP